MPTPHLPTASRPPGRARRIALGTALATGLLALPAPLALAADAPADVCAALDDAVHLRLDARGDSLLTTSRAEADAAQATRGYTDDDGVVFLAAATAADGAAPVRTLVHGQTGRTAYALDATRIAQLQQQGYALTEAPAFYASATEHGCLDAVHELVRESDGQQRFAVTKGQRKELEADGFRYVGVAFWSGTDRRFSIAVIPDTQHEVHVNKVNNVFTHRAQWLADNEDALDLRYITHTGDVVDWDTPDHEQYEKAKPGVDILDRTGIPFSFAIGNHDTMATDVGGSARPGQDTRANQRITDTFNAYFGVDHVENLRGAFQPGKVDNMYTTFAAGGVDWLVLHLELWPRTEMIRWADRVLAAHPEHNVIVNTHSFLTGDGSVYQTNGGYGANSPQFLWDQALKRHANVRFILSGHTGQWAYRAMTGDKGNKVAAINTTLHDRTENPTRIVQFDTTADAMTSYVYRPWSGTYVTTAALDLEALDLVVPAEQRVARLTSRLGSLVEAGRLAPHVAASLQERLDRAARMLDAGSEQRALAAVEQFAARAHNQVKGDADDVAVRGELVAAAGSLGELLSAMDVAETVDLG
ncbi:metallophosphoesterase [Motilibacter aurantiacus]|uniref:metallophosphoesterase n=1 Tax=Motilibacter aurantiacus TaxID=2714955 RepID=UPI00140966E4|nr:metallophosphoesterase [Motilibacter aurantiacus]NHC46455.1 metallophosphoesterase [Motilibacter aurantiacus]